MRLRALLSSYASALFPNRTPRRLELSHGGGNPGGIRRRKERKRETRRNRRTRARRKGNNQQSCERLLPQERSRNIVWDVDAPPTAATRSSMQYEFVPFWATSPLHRTTSSFPLLVFLDVASLRAPFIPNRPDEAPSRCTKWNNDSYVVFVLLC